MNFSLSGKQTGAVAGFALAALLIVVAGYFSGLIQTLGYESRTVAYHGLASSSKAGGGFGLKRMVFFKGQTFFATYDVEVREGSFRIGILDTFGPIGNKPHFVESLTANTNGEVTYQIPKTGIYSIYFEGSVLGGNKGDGYDVSYSVRWGAR